MADNSSELLTPAAFHVLLVLVEGPSHGYAIMAEAERLAAGKLGPGTLYRTVQRLLLDGLIEEARARPGEDSRRIVYAITAEGRAAARAEANRLSLLVQAAKERGLLAGEARPRRQKERER